MAPKLQLTIEEKKNLQQERKLARKQIEIEAKRQLKRAELSRELKHGEHTRKQLEHKWEDMLLNIKLPLLKEEFKINTNIVAMTLDTKDFIISLLLDELDEGKEQYSLSLKNHCEKVNKLYKTYQNRLTDLKNEFDDEVILLYRSLYEQLDNIYEKDNSKKQFLKTIIFALNLQNKCVDKIGLAVNMSKQNVSYKQFLDTLMLYHVQQETKFESIWKKYVEHLDNYNNQTEKMRKNFDKRWDKNILIENIIKNQIQDLFHNYNALKNEREKQEKQKDDSIKITTELNEEKNSLTKLFLLLKERYLEDLKYDGDLLTYLVVESNQSIKALKNVVTLAEKILRIYTLNRKYETRKEKILPFPKVKRLKVDFPEALNMNSLINFWEKCAQADVGRNNISAELSYLLEENYILKNSVRACVNIKCNMKLPPLVPKGVKLEENVIENL